ncbi:hypothetical protein CCACVL1_24776 [Corchorus capsularis]|uniref:Uncharacterized protein n=1 Tax=Corchorus capsularis TaxID=210143 RepID=A0A1R3GN28_COCAP|nr:hypothetical protein CCACVL1_24776 [Corchorus capsularis]
MAEEKRKRKGNDKSFELEPLPVIPALTMTILVTLDYTLQSRLKY